MKLPELKMSTLFGVGAFCFIVQFVTSIWIFYINRLTLSFPAVLSSFASIIFNGIIAYLFFWTWKNNPGVQSQETIIPQSEIDELIKETKIYEEGMKRYVG